MSPIRVSERRRYPANWAAISARIRFVRAGGRCECVGQCGTGHTGRCEARHRQPHPDTGSLVVLTTAHLDHAPENCADENLRAMCQRCHLAYDAQHHAATAAATRATRRTGGMAATDNQQLADRARQLAAKTANGSMDRRAWGSAAVALWTTGTISAARRALTDVGLADVRAAALAAIDQLVKEDSMTRLDTDPLTPNQLGAVMHEFERLGFRGSDRPERLAVAAALLGLGELGSLHELVMGQAGQLLQMLREMPGRAALFAAVAAADRGRQAAASPREVSFVHLVVMALRARAAAAATFPGRTPAA